MSDQPGWKWLGRAADIAQLWPIVVALALVVAAVVKGDDVADAVGGKLVLVGAVGVLALVGLLMIVSGVLHRFGSARTFRADRGRWDSGVLVIGGVLVGIAVILIFAAF